MDHSLGDLPAASGDRLAVTATAMLFEYYACVAETQYPAAHAGLLRSGALCPGHQRNCFFQFNQALCALREYCINLRKKLNAQRHQGRRASVIAVIGCTLQFLYRIEFRRNPMDKLKDLCKSFDPGAGRNS